MLNRELLSRPYFSVEMEKSKEIVLNVEQLVIIHKSSKFHQSKQTQQKVNMY